LVHAIGDDKEAALIALRDRASAAMEAAKERLADLEQQAQRMTQRATVATETYVRENPWTAVSVSAAVGLVLGALLTPTRRVHYEE
jgi:ElaB/YqjD/DUF883 family membrane-anchored ribosome-binding protein